MALHIGLGDRGRARRWRIDLSAVPVEAHQAGSRFGGLLLIVFALLWGGLPTIGLYSALQSAEMGADSAIFLLFPLIGLGIFLLGVRALVWRRTLAFDGQAFTVSERGITGQKTWTEPLTAFDGVLRSTRKVRTRRSSYTLYLIDLVHPDPVRSINLYSDTRESGFRAKWEEYARQLNLPALEQGEGGVLRREATDLDKSLGELLREGKVEVDYDAMARPAEGLAVDVEGDTVVITRTGPKNPWWGSLLAVSFPLIFVGVGFFAPDVDPLGRVVFAGAGILFELLFLAGVYDDLTSRARLRIGPGEVQSSKVKAAGEVSRKTIPAAEVESVHVGKKQNEWRPAVIIASDRETVRFGGGLPRPSLDFVCNTIMAKIAEAGRRGIRR